MEDMSIEFSRMLRETLEKMQERIELQQWDNESDPQLIKKMKDLSELYSSWSPCILNISLKLYHLNLKNNKIFIAYIYSICFYNIIAFHHVSRKLIKFLTKTPCQGGSSRRSLSRTVINYQPFHYWPFRIEYATHSRSRFHGQECQI